MENINYQWIEAYEKYEVDSDSFGDGFLQHNRAYLEWIKEIKDKYPDLIIENCASGDENEASFYMVNSLFSKIHFSGEILSLSDK